MDTFYQLIGKVDATPFQMGMRALLIFIIAVILIRFAGRRSFGMRSAFDNVIGILLGAVLSRSVTGDGNFFSPIIAAMIIAAFHRLFAWISLHSDTFGGLIKGNAKVLYRDGKFFQENMRRHFISHKDFEEGMRKENVETLDKIKFAYLERDGTISIVKQESVVGSQ